MTKWEHLCRACRTVFSSIDPEPPKSCARCTSRMGFATRAALQPPRHGRGSLPFGPGLRTRIVDDLELDDVEPFEVPARGEVIVQVQPERMFHPDCLEIVASIPEVWLAWLRIANTEHLLLPTPVAMFPAGGIVGARLHLRTCDIAERISLKFENHADRVASLRCWFDGDYLSRLDTN